MTDEQVYALAFDVTCAYQTYQLANSERASQVVALLISTASSEHQAALSAAKRRMEIMWTRMQDILAHVPPDRLLMVAWEIAAIVGSVTTRTYDSFSDFPYGRDDHDRWLTVLRELLPSSYGEQAAAPKQTPALLPRTHA